MVFQKLYSSVITGVGNVITSGIEKITGKTYARTTAAEALATPTGKVLATAADIISLSLIGAGVGATVKAAGGVASVAAKAAPTVAKIVTSPKKVLGLVAGAGLIASGAAPMILKTTYTAGKVAGEVITGEKALTPETIMDVGKGLGLVAGVGLLGTAIGYVGKEILTREGEGILTEEEVNAGVPITATPPITPEMVSLEEKPKVARRRTRLQTRRQHIRQSVRVNVVSRSSANRINRKYINTVYVK